MTLWVLLRLDVFAGLIMHLGLPLVANPQWAAHVFAVARFRRCVSLLRAPSASRTLGLWLIAAVCLRSPC